MSESLNESQLRAAVPAKRGLGRALLAGNLPYLAAIILGAGAFYAGRTSAPRQDRVAVVEKGSVVMEAILTHQDRTSAELEREVKQPVLEVLRKYAAAGYTVIDTSRDEAGNMAVAALPTDVIDITAEMRAAVRAAATHAASVPTVITRGTPGAPASAVLPTSKPAGNTPP